MRRLGIALGCLCLMLTATAAAAFEVVVLPKPGFPPPATGVSAAGRRFALRSSPYRSPDVLSPALPSPPEWAAPRFRGHDLQFAVRQRRPDLVFLVYGRDGSSGRYLVRADARTKQLGYAVDFVNFARPPAGGWFEEVTWAREADGVLYVENTHLTFASATRRRNAYISAIDLGTRKTLWRSPALVANACTFVLDGDYIVCGYGFTAEPDFLYLLDRRSGRVLDRLELPTAPEVIKRRGNTLYVRTYDHVVVAQTIGP